MKVHEAENEIWDLENAIKILTQIYEDPESKLYMDSTIKQAIDEYKKRKITIHDCYINMELEDSVDQNTGEVHPSYKDTMTDEERYQALVDNYNKKGGGI